MGHGANVRLVVSCFLLAALAASLPSHPVGAATVNCGDTVGPGAGTVVMDADIWNCGVSPAVTVVGPGTRLEMNGHEVSRASGGIIGILMTGSDAQVRNGRVSQFFTGISVGGTGGHKVWRVAADGSQQNGFHVLSNGNNVSACLSWDSQLRGFVVAGDNNRLTSNFATSNTLDGFLLTATADGNRLEKNHALENQIDGFHDEGTGNSFKENVATENVERNYNLKGAGAKVNQNVASGLGSMTGFYVDCTGCSLKGNRVTTTSTGFELTAAAQNDRLTKNVVLGGTGINPGFEVRAGAGNNLLRQNVGMVVMSGYGTYDADDENVSCGTNTWSGNLFKEVSDPCLLE